MSAALWIVRAPLFDIPATRGNVLTTYEDGQVTIWQRAPEAWLEVPGHRVALSAIDRWWSDGLIAPASLEDGDCFRVQQLLSESTQPRPSWDLAP